jgi:hypothetical protein
VTLPVQNGLLCDGGNKIILIDTALCYKTVLSRKLHTTATATRELTVSTEELQSELRHDKLYTTGHRSMPTGECYYI